MKQQIYSKQNTAQKLLSFIKYNNAFVIGLVLVLFGGGAIIAASPDTRSAIAGREIVIVQGVDNSRIINADLENFDFQMKINNVTEDAVNYYVDYSFRTIGIESNEWQTITRNLQMTVAKDALAGQDLGLYVQKQLASIADNELAYLKQAQDAEIEKGATQIVRTTDYTGLIGLVLDVKNAVLPGYEPVVKPEPAELAQNTEPQTPLEPEALPEPVLTENITTTQETAIEGSQSEAGAAELAQTSQAPGNSNTNATSTIGGQTEPVPAETATESEDSEQSQTELEPNTSITSGIPTPDTSATSTAE